MPETNNKEVGTNIAFDAIRIGLASPEKILEWSRGEVKKPETINSTPKTRRPRPRTARAAGSGSGRGAERRRDNTGG